MPITRNPKEVKGPPIPTLIEERLKRGREAMLKDAPTRRVAYKFWAGEHYWYVNSKNRLSAQDTALFGGAKPPHRIRNKYNFLQSIIEGKVSAATQRVPGYEVVPSTGDWMDREAAIQAARVAAYGYDKWGIRRATTKAVTNALVQREAFAMPYFDPDVGPFTEQINLETGDVEANGLGEIKARVYSRSEVMWEPGTDFDDSRWWATEHAMPVDEAEALPGYTGGKLKANATTADLPSDRDTDNMVLVTTYLERPCKDYPQGRRMVYADKRQIVNPAKLDAAYTDGHEPYPCVGANGDILDEPVLHRLSYTVNPEGDDMGLAERLIDLQRTINDCWNKLLEWKNRCLNPQMKAPVGSFQKGVTQLDDVPGRIRYYNPVGGLAGPEWEKSPVVPRELFDMREAAIADMRALAADVDVQPDPRLAGKTAGLAVETAALRWQSFLGDLAQWHSRLARHCLSLAAVYYTEPRQIEIQGQHSPYTLGNFTGQDLRSQVNVRVTPGSLESQSRQAIREEVQFIATTWPGAVTPEAGIAAIHGGIGSNMLRSYENHVSRAVRMVQLCEQGMQKLAEIPPRYDPDVPTTDESGMPIFQTDELGMVIVDPMTGQPQPMMGDDVPGWMPRKQDNVDIWKQVFGDFMTTPAFDRLAPETQQVFDLVWRGLEQVEQQRAQAEMTQRDMMAAGQGLDNAAAPQMPPPLPDRSQTTPQ